MHRTPAPQAGGCGVKVRKSSQSRDCIVQAAGQGPDRSVRRVALEQLVVTLDDPIDRQLLDNRFTDLIFPMINEHGIYTFYYGAWNVLDPWDKIGRRRISAAAKRLTWLSDF